jgi:molybdopterin-containing oxidoreductase family molybdopterin binding subunit
MMASSNPKELAAAFSQVPFMVSFAVHLDETAELADIVLPDTQFLERFCPFPNWRTVGMVVGQTPWYWPIAQPVAEPAGQARPWAQVFLEIAQAAGFGPELNMVFNTMLDLKEPYRLEAKARYSLEEIADAWAKNWFGPERDIAWFKQHGLITFPKKVEEAYPRPFFSARIPVYLEHFPGIGEKLKQVTDEMGISWDLSDYQPLPDWRGCEAHEQADDKFDLFAINYKLPFHTISVTPQNPWLDELSKHHPYAYKVILNAATARAKGIRDGDPVSVESSYGRVQGLAKLSQGVHPEVVAIAGAFGHWAAGMPVARGKGAHFNSLLSARLSRVDMLSASIDACVKVKVTKQA